MRRQNQAMTLWAKWVTTAECVKCLKFTALISQVWSHKPSSSHDAAVCSPSLGTVPPPLWATVPRCCKSLNLHDVSTPASQKNFRGNRAPIRCDIQCMHGQPVGVQSWQKDASLVLLLLCLPNWCTLHSWPSPAHPTQECQQQGTYRGLLFFLIITHFSPKYAVILVWGELLHPSSSGCQKKREFAISRFQMNSVHPSTIQLCQGTNLQEDKIILWWSMIRLLHPLV